MELERMAVGERAQKRAQRGRGSDTCEHDRHRTVTQDIEMLSAPAAMPTTMLVTLASGAAAAPFFVPVSLSFSATSRGRQHRSASRTTGTSPAYASRFGSSNAAETAAGVWETCISEVPC
ncbi:hypothetical protein [Streptantibioticus ferralitis]|uniref:hypothetical protein n=1 Tax=Streptantibioticus ferralitis TaxID=236510 RepID=UPI003CD08D0E